MLTKTEQLDADNKLECDGCKTYQQVTKKLYFWETPATIILFFNRFLDIANSDKEIDFPIDNLDINKYCFNYNPSDNNIFNLIGIGIYCGNGHAGHYSAIIKNQNGKWYHIDDEDVNEINEDIILIIIACCIKNVRKNKDDYRIIFLQYNYFIACCIKNVRNTIRMIIE